MYYISISEKSPLDDKQVKHLKPITFPELPGIDFVIFQEIDTKNWNITEVETGLGVTIKPTKEEAKNSVLKKSEQLITVLDRLKQKPIVGYKKIPLVNQEPQPTGAKLSKVLTYNGIKNKFLVKHNTVEGIDFYIQVNENSPYGAIFVECNGYFVNVGQIPQTEGIAKQIITENINIHQWIESGFNKSLESEQNCFLGYAAYLDRMEEALTHNKKLYDKENEKNLQRGAEKQREEEEQKQKEQEAITEAENKVINNEKISGEIFVALCDEYGIKLPLRTRGWSLKSLVEISDGEYKHYNNESTVIMDYYRDLKKTITEVNKLISA